MSIPLSRSSVSVGDVWIDTVGRRWTVASITEIRVECEETDTAALDSPEHFIASMDRRACGFCKGKPVRNAARWWDEDVEEFAPCPRCGELHEPSPVAYERSEGNDAS